MFVTAGALGRYVQQKLSPEDIWKGSFGKVKEAVKAGLSVCERWTQACESLTIQFWKRYSPHPWKGDKHVPQTLVDLTGRLEEVSMWSLCVSKCLTVSA